MHKAIIDQENVVGKLILALVAAGHALPGMPSTIEGKAWYRKVLRSQIGTWTEKRKWNLTRLKR